MPSSFEWGRARTRFVPGVTEVVVAILVIAVCMFVLGFIIGTGM